MTHKWIKIYELKCICKDYAKQIKEYRTEYKKVLKETAGMDWRVSSPIWAELNKKYPLRDSHEYRLYHIAYCLLRGKLYEQVENKVHDCNKLSAYDWAEIEKIRTQYYEVVEHQNPTDALEVV